jgi:hypothetical protein
VSDPPLRPLHSEGSLSPAKLVMLNRVSTDVLLLSLLPGTEHCLKVRPDGTILDGHHRIKILRERGVDVDALPRETIVRE